MKALAGVTMCGHQPSDSLRPFIRRLQIIEFENEIQDFHLPDTGLVAAFRFRGECVLDGTHQAPAAALTGFRSSVRSHDHGGNSAVAIVGFTTLGASNFVSAPLHEFFDQTCDLADAVGAQAGVRDLCARLEDAPDHSSRFHFLERFLLSQLKDHMPDPLIASAIQRLNRGCQEVRVRELARNLGLSQSAFERRFKRAVGASPRQFASVVRLQQVLALRDEGKDLSSIAIECGYFDQSHFIKDFRRLTGKSPSSYFAG